MTKIVKFKHFKNNTENALCNEIEEWINGELPVHWVEDANFLEGSDNKWHCFVKYLEEE